MPDISSITTISCSEPKKGIQQIDQSKDQNSEFRLQIGDSCFSVKGKATSPEGRIISHVAPDTAPDVSLNERSTVTFYHDYQHTFVHLKCPATEGREAIDMARGKYPRNKSFFGCGSKLQVLAAGLPSPLSYVIGLPMMIMAKACIIGGLSYPVDAFLNDEKRLYQQFGEQWSHHPHVTFVLKPEHAYELQEWLNDLNTRSLAGENPLKFQLLCNDCHAFTRKAFNKTGFPGQFVDYFEEEALRSRSFGAAENQWMSQSFPEGLTRLYNNFISPWVHWTPYTTYKTPTLSDTDIRELITRAEDEIATCRDTAQQVSAPQKTGWVESFKAYLSSASDLTTAHRLQSEERYAEALDVLNKTLENLKKEFLDNSKADAVKESIDDVWRNNIAQSLRFVAAIANKTGYKAENKLKEKELQEKKLK